jgi:hypothetical protein
VKYALSAECIGFMSDEGLEITFEAVGNSDNRSTEDVSDPNAILDKIFFSFKATKTKDDKETLTNICFQYFPSSDSLLGFMDL